MGTLERGQINPAMSSMENKLALLVQCRLVRLCDAWISGDE